MWMEVWLAESWSPKTSQSSSWEAVDMLPHKRDSADLVKSTTLRWGDDPYHPGEPSVITRIP